MVRAIETEEQPTRFANFALGLYAGLCNLVGLVFTLTGAWMSNWLGIPGWVATVFGVAVLLWSFMVTLYANRKVTRRNELDVVLFANLGILVAALIVLVVPGSMSAGGKTLLAVGAGVVAAFSVAQALARRTLDPPTAS